MGAGRALVLAAAWAVATPLAAADLTVEAPAVAARSPIGAGAEGGVFGGYHYLDPRDLPWHLRAGPSVGTAVGGDATLGQVTPCASVWLPLGHAAFVGFGAGFTWASGRAAGGGVRELHAGPTVLVRLGPEWFAAGGAFYQRPARGPAGGPIDAQRGDHGRWSVGAGIGHAWR